MKGSHIDPENGFTAFTSSCNYSIGGIRTRLHNADVCANLACCRAIAFVRGGDDQAVEADAPAARAAFGRDKRCPEEAREGGSIFRRRTRTAHRPRAYDPADSVAHRVGISPATFFKTDCR